MSNSDVLSKVQEFEQGLRVEPLKNHEVNGRFIDGVELEGEVLKDFARPMRIPYKYLERCPNSLASENVDHWLEIRDLRDEMGIAYAEDRIVTFIEDYDTGVVPVSDLLEAGMERLTQEGIPFDLEVKGLGYDDAMFNFVFPEREDEVQEGDVLRGGVNVSHSMLDSFLTELNPYVLRLVCTNGMVRRDERIAPRRKTFRKDPPNIFADSLIELYGGVDNIVHEFSQTSHVEVSNPRRVLARLLEESRVLRNYEAELYHRLGEAQSEDGVETLYDLLNVITFVGTHEVNENDLIRSIQRAAGNIVSDHSRVCNSCNQPV